jgi:hypothetical protein
MLRSRSSITLALPQFFENDEIGRAWMRSREREIALAFRSPRSVLNIAALTGAARRAVAWVRGSLATSAADVS